MSLLLKILNKIFPKIESPIEIGKNDVVNQLERNTICYCGSNKKYKNCHLDSNRKEKKIAITIVNSLTKAKTNKVIYIEDYNRFKGVKVPHIGVNDTYDEIEIGIAEDFDSE